MREIYLHGALGREFGRRHRMDVKSIPEAMQALAANFPEILKRLRGGFFKVILGKSKSAGTEIGEDEIVSVQLGDKALHVVPVVAGSKGGLGKILAGVLLIGLAVFTGGTALMSAGLLGSTTLGGILTSVGTGLVISGVASLLAPEQKSGDDQKSFTLAGPQVTLREGGIIPIAYGEVWTGGTMIAGSLRVQNGTSVG